MSTCTVRSRSPKFLAGAALVEARYCCFEHPRHFHDELTVGVLKSGLSTVDIGRIRYEVCPGHVVVIPPGEVHTGQTVGSEPQEYRAISFRPELLNRLIGDLPVPQPRVSAGGKLAWRLAHLIEWLMDHPEDSEASLDLEQSVVSILNPLASGPFVPSSPPECIRRARDAMRSDPTLAYTLRDLAELAGLSPFYFLELFRETVGVTPHRFLMVTRVELAKKLLSEGHSAGDAAVIAGFADQSHLTRCFRRFVGTTPARFSGTSRDPKNVLAPERRLALSFEANETEADCSHDDPFGESS